MVSDALIERIKELPPDLQQQLLDFAEFLASQRARSKNTRLRLTWAGALREFRDQYSSVGLQHGALDWWNRGSRGRVRTSGRVSERPDGAGGRGGS